MRITENPYAPYPEIVFVDKEVSAVAAAFQENNERLERLGNDSSVSARDKYVASWTGDSQAFTLNQMSQLLDPLEEFVDTTEDKVDEALDTEESHSIRIENAARRYELGYHASRIVTELITFAERVEDDKSE
jgi:hypothetical protein